MHDSGTSEASVVALMATVSFRCGTEILDFRVIRCAQEMRIEGLQIFKILKYLY